MDATDTVRSSRPGSARRRTANAVLLAAQRTGSVAIAEVVLHGRGIRTIVAEDPRQALAVIRRVCPKLIVLDIDLPSVTDDVLRDIVAEARAGASCAVVLLGATDAAAGCRLATDVDADAYSVKPLDSFALAERAQEAFAAVTTDRGAAQ